MDLITPLLHELKLVAELLKFQLVDSSFFPAKCASIKVAIFLKFDSKLRSILCFEFVRTYGNGPPSTKRNRKKTTQGLPELLASLGWFFSEKLDSFLVLKRKLINKRMAVLIGHFS